MVKAADQVDDAQALAIAHNHLGVVLHEMGDYEGALAAHTLHSQLENTPSEMIAHMNRALAQTALGLLDGAAKSHEQALLHAVRSSALNAESVICGNMSLAGNVSGEVDTARSCMQRHEYLSRTLNNVHGQGDAHIELGELEAKAGNAAEADHHLQRALGIATDLGMQQAANQSKVQLGLLQGALQFDRWIQSVETPRSQPTVY